MSGLSYIRLHAVARSTEELAAQIREDATQLSGQRNDMAGRAAAYHEIYALSYGNLTFPLIAAHGALWARWYLRLAHLIAHIIAAADFHSPLRFREKLSMYVAFVDAFKDINSKVFVETYTAFHLSRVCDADELAAAGYPDAVTAQLKMAHTAAADCKNLPTEIKRDIYEAFFRWEQIYVVGPDVDRAMEAFHWPLMKWFCLRPWVWLSYFRLGQSLNFKNFADAEERTQKGLIAFDRAAALGWDKIEANLLGNPLFDAKRDSRSLMANQADATASHSARSGSV